jgi:hypothetical protein
MSEESQSFCFQFCGNKKFAVLKKKLVTKFLFQRKY